MGWQKGLRAQSCSPRAQPAPSHSLIPPHMGPCVCRVLPAWWAWEPFGVPGAHNNNGDGEDNSSEGSLGQWTGAALDLVPALTTRRSWAGDRHPGGGVGRWAGDRETGGDRREVGEETRTGRKVGRPALSAPRSSKAICPSPSRGTHVMTSVSSPGSLSSPSTNTEVLVKLCVLQVRPSSTLNLQRAGNHHHR